MMDVYTWPTPNGHKVADARGLSIDEYPNVKRWFDSIDARPAVQRGVKALADAGNNAPHDPKSWDIMFGKTQFQRR